MEEHRSFGKSPSDGRGYGNTRWCSSSFWGKAALVIGCIAFALFKFYSFGESSYDLFSILFFHWAVVSFVDFVKQRQGRDLLSALFAVVSSVIFVALFLEEKGMV